MTTSGNKAVPDDDRALEALLGQAAPRPTPSEDATARARAALGDEWRGLVRARTRRRRIRTLAVAATVVLGVSIAINVWRTPAPVAEQVATLGKAFGTLYLLGEHSELTRADNLEVILAGQTIVTADEAGVALDWSDDGSLRVDENTEIRFISAARIELAHGRVYFDSGPEPASGTQLAIVTPHGILKHIGTQFIAASDDNSLTVSVREGRVSIEGRFHDAVAAEGERLRFVGTTRPERLNVAIYGPDWEWIEATAPVAAMRGRRLYEFLVWISRETGLEFRFESDDVERIAREESVTGDLSSTPRVALRQSLSTADLAFDIDDGIIRIRQADN